MALTQQQINAMVVAHNNAVTAQDPSIYYTALAQHYTYGTLAVGIVRDNTLSGIVANNYAENKIVNDLGGSFTTQKQHQLMMELMDRDFDLRSARGWDRECCAPGERAHRAIGICNRHSRSRGPGADEHGRIREVFSRSTAERK